MHRKTVVDFKDLKHRMIFENALMELKTRELSDVKTVLDKVAYYQSKGYYVVGYVSYEAAPAFEEKLIVKNDSLCDEYLAYFTVHKNCEILPFPLDYNNVEMPKDWQSDTSQEQYQLAIATIHDEIKQGNTYQVNYTLRLSAETPSDAWAIYNRLVVEQGAAYNAYILHDDFSVISVSPELFFEQKNDKLITRPMKGTTHRGLTTSSDKKQALWLQSDIKNRAENMMIVDLLRNDMGKICQIGSVKVSQLCSVEQYSTVWQMTSTIIGDLKEGVELPDIFSALFPCGSITGAPKISTMKIINRLEMLPRGIYCGTIGICLPNGRRIFNVAIRTLQIKSQKAYYGVGGGITWDSNWLGEYEETQQKSQVLYRESPSFQLITTARVENGVLKFRKEHLTRLKESADYFSYPFDKDKLNSSLTSYLSGHKGLGRLRIALSKNGEWQLDLQKLDALSTTFLNTELVLQDETLLNQPFTYFKTSYRPHLDLGSQEKIYYNHLGQLLETSIGNLILEIEGQWFTPESSLGLLNGIYRQKLIEKGQVTECVLTLDDLKRASKILACNAVRGVYQLNLDKISFDNLK